MSETTQTVELGEAEAKAIAKHVAAPEIDNEKIAQLVAEKMAILAQAADKEVNKLAGGKTETHEVEVLGKFDKLSKEAFAIKQLSAALSGNHSELQELNDHALKSLKEKGIVNKATYLNAGTDADGAVLVPNAELLGDILSVLPEYSPLANELRTINLVNGSSIDISAITADVVMTEVGSEGGAKTVTKPTLGDSNVAVREFAGIALMTKKLIQQSALDVYGILRDSFARAIAKKREQLILTDSSSGIVNKSGVTVLTASSGDVAAADITLAQLKSMPFQVPTQSAAGGIYVFSRLLLGSLAGREDTTGQPIVTVDAGAANGLTGTFNGYRYVVAETLGTSDAVSTVHAVFGNFAKFGVVVRQGAIDTAVFDSGTVTDGSSVVHNLIQENKLAMRVETWENVGYPMPSAFVRLRTAAS